MKTSYRSRYLAAMTLGRIDALPDKAWAPVVLAAGAIEQHGPHLPVAVDAMLGQVWCEDIVRGLNPEVSCYFAPPITIGKSNEHVGFPGTLMIGRETLREQVLTVARQAAGWGFKSLLVLNTHGGNAAVLVSTLREVRAELGLRCALWGGDFESGMSRQEQVYGIHGGELETAWMLTVAPKWVRMEEALCHYPASVDEPGELRAEFAPATFSWAAQDLSPQGVFGDATAATAEKGWRWREAYVRGKLLWLERWCAAMRAESGRG